MSNANWQNYAANEAEAIQLVDADAEAVYQNQKLQDFYRSQNLSGRINQSPIEAEKRMIILPPSAQRAMDAEDHLRTTEMQKAAISRLFNYDRTDIPSDTKLEMILWMRQNTLVVCPHCLQANNPCIRVTHPGFGLCICREDKCGQAFNAWESLIMNLGGNELSANDLPEKFAEYAK